MLTDAITLPDAAEIRRDLEYMTARWGELPDPVVFELRAFNRDGVPRIAKFAPDWIDEAVEWCERQNEQGLNIYAVRNPIRHDAPGSASDKDVVAAFFLWADCDDPASAGNVKRFDGPKYSAAVTTGRVPSTRVHVYWALETPCTDMAAWREMQMRIAAHFNSDSTVVNPSRIMRVGGTVSYPAKHKVERGYVKEVTTIRTEYADERQPVTLAQMDRVFAASAAALPLDPAPGGLQIDVGPQPLDRALAAANILAGTDWRENVKKLVASYVARGWTDDEIIGRCLAFTLNGWTADDTRRDVAAFIKWTREQEALNGGLYATSPDTINAHQADQKTDKIEATWPTLMSEFDGMAIPRRRWVYGTDYIRGYLSVVASAGGIGKTSNAIVEGLSIVTGKPLLGTPVNERCKVWIINLEDPRDEILMRTIAAMQHYGLGREEIEGNLFLDGENDIQITLAAEGRDGLVKNDALLSYMRDKIIACGIGVVIIDPFISTHLVNENSNASIQAVVAMFRSLARDTDASVSLVHHTRKGNGQDADIDSVRGAGSLIGAARAARVINRVSEKDALEMGVRQDEARGIFRIDDGKANLAPPAEKAVYRRMVGVQIANGEWVGVAVPFELPDEWSGLTDAVVNTILGQINAGIQNVETEEYYSLRPQDKARWVGQLITDYPFNRAEDFKTEGQAKQIIKTWLKNGLIEEMTYHSAAQRKDRKGVIATGRVGEQK